MSPVSARDAPGTTALVATGCGTALASVCALGLFQIERLLGGVWSLGAVLTAGLCCWGLARACARLTDVLPSGAGPLAFVSRGLGRKAGLVVVVPYLLPTLFLVGAEATIVGVLFERLLSVPAVAGAMLFLVGTWGVCRAGVRLSYRAQALATWALVAGLGGISVLAISQAAHQGGLAERLLPPFPDVGSFIAGIGQALFLFMGFELITSQAEVAAGPRCVRRALGVSVVVLAGLYGVVSLGFSCLIVPPEAGEQMVPQLAVAEQGGGTAALLLVAVLSLLASFTSFNGALLTLSRLTAALGAQGILPRRLARVEPRSLVPHGALIVLLALAVAATTLVSLGDALRPSILAAAVSAAVLYASLLCVRERAAFVEPGRRRAWQLMSMALIVALLSLAAGVLLDAGPALGGTLALLASAYAAAMLAASRSGRRTAPRARPAEVPEGVTHAG